MWAPRGPQLQSPPEAVGLPSLRHMPQADPRACPDCPAGGHTARDLLSSPTVHSELIAHCPGDSWNPLWPGGLCEASQASQGKGGWAWGPGSSEGLHEIQRVTGQQSRFGSPWDTDPPLGVPQHSVGSVFLGAGAPKRFALHKMTTARLYGPCPRGLSSSPCKARKGPSWTQREGVELCS